MEHLLDFQSKKLYFVVELLFIADVFELVSKLIKTTIIKFYFDLYFKLFIENNLIIIILELENMILRGKFISIFSEFRRLRLRTSEIMNLMLNSSLQMK